MTSGTSVPSVKSTDNFHPMMNKVDSRLNHYYQLTNELTMHNLQENTQAALKQSSKVNINGASVNDMVSHSVSQNPA